jgi:hypothetical protein
VIGDVFAGLFHLLVSGGLLVPVVLLVLGAAVLWGYRWGRRDQARRAVDEAVRDARWRRAWLAEVDAARTIPVQQRRGGS